MIRKSILLGCVLAVAAGPALADGPSTEEKAGVGIGVVVGAVAGGPLGAMFGAAVGAKIGDEFYQRNEEVDSLSVSLMSSEEKVYALQRDIVELKGEIRTRDGELKHVKEIARPELLTMLKAGIEMDLLFRTDEHVLSDATGGRLRQLAGSLAANPDILIRLDGFADERGDATYNQALSARRADHVRDVLVAAGIPVERITTNARGESPAAEQTVDSFALERRVSLTLYMGDTPAFASAPK